MKSRLPAWITVIAVDDRSFGRTELARTCQHLGFHYVIRIQPNAYVASGEFRGRLDLLLVQRGVERLLGDAPFPKQNPVTRHVAIC